MKVQIDRYENGAVMHTRFYYAKDALALRDDLSRLADDLISGKHVGRTVMTAFTTGHRKT